MSNHKHLMPPEAQPPKTQGVPQAVSGGLAFKNTPHQRGLIVERAKKRAKTPATYLRNEVIRAIQEDLRLA